MSPVAERMSRVDTAWLRMDNAVNLMMIVGVWFLKPAITVGQMRERVAETLLKYPRFRQRVVEDAMGAQWVEDEQFDLERHVVAERLRRKRGQTAEQALQARVGELALTPLDRERPLWQWHVIEQYDGGTALISRIHHCIGDGIALVQVMLSMTDGARRHEAREPRHAAGPEGDWLVEALVKPLTDLTVKAIGMTGEGVVKSLDLLVHPEHGVAGTVELARTGLQVVNDVAALALMPDDSPTLLKGEPVGRKVVAWGPPLPLEPVKTIGKALGCSVNDVLLSCVTGAIGHYLRERGEDTAGKEIRAMVPVNLRPLETAHQLGNRFGLVPLVLPIGIEHPLERLAEVNARMAALKGSYQPVLAFAILAVAGLLVKPAQDALLGLFARKTTAVMTNVPGPKEPLYLCGSKVERTLFWVPQSGHIGMGVSILSYAGAVQFGLITDERLCPDPQAVVGGFEPEFEKLVYLALLGT